MIVREILPGAAARTVVLANRPPRAFAQVGPPPLPMYLALPGFFQAKLFLCHSIRSLCLRQPDCYQLIGKSGISPERPSTFLRSGDVPSFQPTRAVLPKFRRQARERWRRG